MKRALHLLRHAVRPLAGFLLAHWISCWLDFFSAEDWKEQMASNRTSVHLSLLTGCVVAWMAGYAVRFRPRESSYFVQPVSYGERLGIQVVTVLVVGILGPLIVQWMVIGGRAHYIRWWPFRYAMHHGRPDYLLVMAFFITGLLGLSWLRALLLAGISYWLAYSCLLAFEFLDVNRVHILLHWGLFWGLGLVGLAVWKRRVELTAFRLSMLCALGVIGISVAISYADHLRIERQLTARLEQTFEKHPTQNAYTLRVISSVNTAASPEADAEFVLNLEAKQFQVGYSEIGQQKVTWAWRNGTEEQWSAASTASMDYELHSGVYKLHFKNPKSQNLQIQDGQIKFQAFVELALEKPKIGPETTSKYYMLEDETFSIRASRWVEFVIDNVTVALPGAAQSAPSVTKNALKSRYWGDGVNLRLATVDPNHLPSNLIELADYVQHHSAEEIAPLVTKWLPELIQLLEMQVAAKQITTAIETAVTENQKAQIIAKVPTVPQLIPVLLAKGWLLEAKREIIASNGPGRLTPAITNALIDTGDPDFYPLILIGVQQSNAAQTQIRDLSSRPALVEYLWTHGPKQHESLWQEHHPIASLVIKSGYLPALMAGLEQKSFWVSEFLRDDHLLPIHFDKSTLQEIRKHQDRVIFHPALKIFIYTPPLAP